MSEAAASSSSAIEQQALKDEVFYFEVVKAHHEHRWLKQTRLLIVTPTEIMKADNTTLRPADPSDLKPTKRFPISSLDVIALKSKTSFLLRFMGGDHDYFYKSDRTLDILQIIKLRFAKLRAAAVVCASTAPSAQPAAAQCSPAVSSGVPSIAVQPCSPKGASSSSRGGGERGGQMDTGSPDGSLAGSMNSPSAAEATTPARRSIVACEAPRMAARSTEPTVIRRDILDLFSGGALDLPSGRYDTDEFLAQKLDLLRAMRVDALDDMDKLRTLIATTTAAATARPQSQSLAAAVNERSNNSNPSSNSFDGVPPMCEESAATNHQQLPVPNPVTCLKFRHDLNRIKESFPHQLATRERSLSSKFAGKWNSRKLPKFEDEGDAILIVEEALQTFVLTQPIHRYLSAELAVEYAAEQRRFDHHCSLLNNPRVPFSFFGVRQEFQPIKFDLVLICLQDLEACSTPVALLQKIVEAIKSVIVCIKTFLLTEKRLTASRHSSPLASARGHHSSRGGFVRPASPTASGVGTQSPSIPSSPRMRFSNSGYSSPAASQPASQTAFTCGSAEVSQLAGSRNQGPSPLSGAKHSDCRNATASPVGTASQRASPMLAADDSAAATESGSSVRAGGGTSNSNSQQTLARAPDGLLLTSSSEEGDDELRRSHEADDEIDSHEEREQLSEKALAELARECDKQYSTDDILPVFIYILVHCRVPRLVLHRAFVEQIGDTNEATERIYYFTVFCSAVQWIVDWVPPEGHHQHHHEPGSPLRHRSRSSLGSPRNTRGRLASPHNSRPHSKSAATTLQQQQAGTDNNSAASFLAANNGGESQSSGNLSPVNRLRRRRESAAQESLSHSPFSTPRLMQKSPNSSEPPSVRHSFQ